MTAGIDTVGVSFPIRDADTVGATASIVAMGTPEERHTYRRALPGGGFLAWGIGDHAWVEASLPKRVNEDNVEALPADQAVEAIRDMYAEALNYVEAYNGDHVYSMGTNDQPRLVPRSWQTATVKRLDLVRDFDGVTAIDSLLNGLATVKQDGRSKVRRFADPERGRAETLRVGPKSWAATLYDKHAETKLAAPGRLRFEARLRSRQLRSADAQKIRSTIAHVSDISTERVQTMTSRMFERVGFDREVAGTAQLAAAINDCDDLSPRVKRELVGYLAGRAMGIELEFSSNTERKYRKLAQRLGLVLTDDCLAESFTARLDFESGTQVLTAA